MVDTGLAVSKVETNCLGPTVETSCLELSRDRNGSSLAKVEDNCPKTRVKTGYHRPKVEAIKSKLKVVTSQPQGMVALLAFKLEVFWSHELFWPQSICVSMIPYIVDQINNPNGSHVNRLLY